MPALLRRARDIGGHVVRGVTFFPRVAAVPVQFIAGGVRAARKAPGGAFGAGAAAVLGAQKVALTRYSALGREAGGRIIAATPAFIRPAVKKGGKAAAVPVAFAGGAGTVLAVERFAPGVLLRAGAATVAQHPVASGVAGTAGLITVATVATARGGVGPTAGGGVAPGGGGAAATAGADGPAGAGGGQAGPAADASAAVDEEPRRASRRAREDGGDEPRVHRRKKSRRDRHGAAGTRRDARGRARRKPSRSRSRRRVCRDRSGRFRKCAR